MQIKSEHKYLKSQLPALLINTQNNRIIKNNQANINDFFDLFQQIKQHRTLQKLCQVFSQQQKQQIFKSYQNLVDKLEQLMEKFEIYAQNTKKKYIVLQKVNYTLQQWRQAIEVIYCRGKHLLATIQSNLKMIIKAFNLNLKIPFVDWDRWRLNCIKPVSKNVSKCLCFL